jgi:hypothetical protein
MNTASRLACELAASVTAVLALLLCIPSLAGAADAQRDDVARTVARQSGGRVLSVEPAKDAPAGTWRVKVLAPSGDVFVREVPQTPAVPPPGHAGRHEPKPGPAAQ